MKYLILLFSIITATHCFTIPFFKSTRHLSIRELLDEEIKEKVCSNMGDYEDINKTNLDAYVKEMDFEESSARELVIGLLTKGEVEGIKDVLSDVAIWVVMIVLAGIILITWPIFICCCTVGCCCFNKNVKAGCCGFVYYVLAMALYFGVVVSSIVGFTSANKFVHSFNGSTCSLINFVYHTANGEEKEELPKWIGTNNIIEAIENLTEPIGAIDQQYDSAFGHTSKYNGLEGRVSDYKTNYVDKVKNDLYDGKTVTSPSNNAIIPLFIKKFNTEGEYNIAITTEYKAYIESASKSTKTLQETALELKDSDSLNSTLVGFQEDFNDIQETITDATEPIIDNVVKIRGKAFDIFLLAFKILYGIFVAFSVILMALLTLYALIKCFLFKIPVHIIWNIIMLICILTLIIGALLGILSYIFGAVSPVLTFLLSKDFLPEGDASNYIDICLNGDGDLAKEFDIMNSIAKYLEVFNDISRTIENLSSKMPEQSEVYTRIDNELQAVKNDISLATDSTYGDDDVTAVINSMNAITYNANNICGTLDYYTTKECPSGFNTPISFQILSGTPQKNCYKLPQQLLTLNYDNSAYSAACQAKAEELVKKKEYLDVLLAMVGTTQGDLTPFSQSASDLFSDINNVYTSTSTMTSSMIKVVNNAVGPDSDLFSMFNCDFLSHDLIQFINQFHNKFTKSCRDIGISCLCGSFFSYIGVYILLRAMYHYSPQAKKNTNKDKQNTQISTEIVEIKPKK